MIKALLEPEIVLTFRGLQEQAYAAAEPDPTAMTLATADRDGRVSLRAVLLKQFDERGFVFYTNLRSLKGQQLSDNARAAINFLWLRIGNQVQVRAEGEIERVSDAEADAYFASRARDSQIGAWASKQSETLPDRATFDRRMDEYRLRFDGQPVPRPPHWTGLRLRPDRVEFWYGARYRLHQRDCWELLDGNWQRRLLYP